MAITQPSFVFDKLSYEIFNILENRFLFGYDDPNATITPAKIPNPLTPAKIRVLSIDDSAVVSAAVALARLESSLAKQCGIPTARIADFFDIAAGSGSGGVLAAMLFARSPIGRPLFSADEALRFIIKNRRKLSSAGRRRVFRRSGKLFLRMFGESTLRDTIKPVLIPCYDLETGSPLVFSRTDAIETDSFDFFIRDVCRTTCSEKERVMIKSVDGRTRIDAVGGGVVMQNPTAMAITHVLNNKLEFPFATNVEDLLVLSLGGGAAEIMSPTVSELLKIARDCTAEMVDQSVAMAFGQSRLTSYVRIQAHNPENRSKASPLPLETTSEHLLNQRCVDSVLFRERKLSEKSNGDRLDMFGGELISEHDRRKGSTVPTVLIKPSFSPRMSSAASWTATTMTSMSSPAASLPCDERLL